MGRRLVVNVRMLSFAHTMNDEATKSPSVTVRAGTREWKGPSAPGEVPVKVLSDGGSTPPTSTKAKILSRKWQDFCVVFFILQFSVFIFNLQ